MNIHVVTKYKLLDNPSRKHFMQNKQVQGNDICLFLSFMTRKIQGKYNQNMAEILLVFTLHLLSLFVLYHGIVCFTIGFIVLYHCLLCFTITLLISNGSFMNFL